LSNRSQGDFKKLKLPREQKVILIAAPGGAGKTSTAARIAQVDSWTHISEDRVWDELPRDPHTPRTDEEKTIVQARTVAYVQAQLAKGNSVVLEFIVYENPPQPIIFYQSELEKIGVPVHVRVLRPSLDEILLRQGVRANNHDTEVDLAARKANAEHQIRCLSSEYIKPDWIIDTSRAPLEAVYQRYFAYLVDEPMKDE
jgi:adenylate kinase family enzyme